MTTKDLIARMELYAGYYKDGRNLGREIEGTVDLLTEAAALIKRHDQLLKDLVSVQITDDIPLMEKVIRISFYQIQRLSGESVAGIVCHHLREMAQEIDLNRLKAAHPNLDLSQLEVQP